MNLLLLLFLLIVAPKDVTVKQDVSEPGIVKYTIDRKDDSPARLTVTLYDSAGHVLNTYTGKMTRHAETAWAGHVQVAKMVITIKE